MIQAIKKELIEDIEAIATLTSGKQKKYFEDMLKAAQPVEISSIHEVFSTTEIKKIKDLVRPKMKKCYRNAHLLTCLFPDRVKYVDGRVFAKDVGIPIDHAFNRVGDKYVDITFEMVVEKDVSKCDYIKFGEYDIEQVDETAEKTGYYGECYKFMWLKENNYRKNL